VRIQGRDTTKGSRSELLTPERDGRLAAPIADRWRQCAVCRPRKAVLLVYQQVVGHSDLPRSVTPQAHPWDYTLRHPNGTPASRSSTQPLSRHRTLHHTVVGNAVPPAI
jgi:hypothetical protein